MTASRIVLWRHGRTEWNRDNRFQGQADIGLDDLGRRQAAQAAPVLARLEPTALWSSDLIRASETAQSLAALTGLTVQTDPRLREIHVGSWQGLTGDEVWALDPEAQQRIAQGEDVRRSATGETVAEVAERVAGALSEIAAAMPDGSTVVVATHGLAARAGVCRMVGQPPELWSRLGSLDNCCWSVLEWHRGGGFWRVATHNQAATPGVDTIS